MSRPEHLVRALALAVAVCFVSALMPLSAADAGQRTLEGAADTQEVLDVAVSQDGELRLDANAPPPPINDSGYSHFGLYTSSPLAFSSLLQSVQLSFTTVRPGDGQALVDLRVSLDGQRWSEWEVDHVSGDVVRFTQPGRYVQYRARLFGNIAPVAIRDIAVKPTGTVDMVALDVPPVAPTFKIHATRMGMVGGRTANGHRITKRDHYVSLPSWRSLSSRGGSEYMVRVTYNGRSSVAPVYDVGPWNVHDDYWNKERERFGDLPWGYPQDHAAYFDKYNKGYAEKGRVRFPTAIDIGDGVWWDDLKIKGDRAVVEVTFLWLGTDPLESQATPTAAPTEAPTAAPTETPMAAPEAPTVAPEATPAPTEAPTAAPEATPAPTETPTDAPTAAPEATPAPTETPTAVPTKEPEVRASEVVVGVDSAAFHKVRAKLWYDSPSSCGPDLLHWTYTTMNPDESENTARWQPKLAADSRYNVSVYIPDCEIKADRTASARYLVKHQGGVAEVTVDQAQHGGEWVSLGSYAFAKGQEAYVELSDVTKDSMKALWYADVKWTPDSTAE